MQEVEAWIHADESCLMTQQQGRFLVHFCSGNESPRTYAADSTPSHVWNAEGQLHYSLAPIAAHACMLR